MIKHVIVFIRNMDFFEWYIVTFGAIILVGIIACVNIEVFERRGQDACGSGDAKLCRQYVIQGNYKEQQQFLTAYRIATGEGLK